MSDLEKLEQILRDTDYRLEPVEEKPEILLIRNDHPWFPCKGNVVVASDPDAKVLVKKIIIERGSPLDIAPIHGSGFEIEAIEPPSFEYFFENGGW